MTDTDTQALDIKTILILVVVAIVTAVVVTLIQTIILGKANVAITGGVVGAIVVGTAMSARRKKVS
jgi:hypothetical protein